MHFARKTSLFAGAVATLGFSGSSALAGSPQCRTYQPIEATSEVLGSKAALAYFVSMDEACSVVLMISEKFVSEADAPATSAARIRLALAPGGSASMDSEEGGSLMIQCGRDAGVMHVTTGSREEITELAQQVGVSPCASDAGGSAMRPLRISGFGPLVSGDASLNHNMGALAQKIAWNRSPESDVFQLAIASPEEGPFENVALDSDPMHGASFSPRVHDGPSLNANEDALTQWIAYRNSPKGNAFRPAEPQTAVASAAFLSVALASIPRGSLGNGDQ